MRVSLACRLGLREGGYTSAVEVFCWCFGVRSEARIRVEQVVLVLRFYFFCRQLLSWAGKVRL